VKAAVEGETTGRVWRYHPTMDRIDAPGERWKATADDDGSPACVHIVQKDGLWQDEVDLLRVAIGVARLPEVVRCPTLLRLLDTKDVETVEMKNVGTVPGSLFAIWEWATLSLHEYLADPDGDPEAVAAEVAANVGRALDVLHRLGYVHLDVAPNNILLVDRVWKLADYDSCVREGEPAGRLPRSKQWLHPDRVPGDSKPPAARKEFDLYGLEQVVAAITGRRSRST
jgi:hypothetical protein